MTAHRVIERAEPHRPSLRAELSRTHLGVALAAVCMAGLTVTMVCLWTLSAYAEQNLKLIARSIAYTVEAAVVFRDGAAADDAVRLIASVEDVATATVYDLQGVSIAYWHRPDPGAWHGLEERMAHWLLSRDNVEPILQDGVKIGEVRVQGSGNRLLAFLAAGLGGMVACLLLTALGAFYLSRRMVSRIVGPLDLLARVAHGVRRDREFSQRVPAAHIAEINELGQDFNSLLDELETWQVHLQKENESLAYRAEHDGLTGLPNRAYFVEHLGLALQEEAAVGGRAAVLFIDCDRFKSINDELGHAAGDAVLISIAKRIRSRLREQDLVARLGGDEFAVLLMHLSNEADAAQVADDILARMRAPILLPDGQRIVTSLTIGIALYPEHGDAPDTLMHRADIAMYHAKRRARGTRRLANPFDEEPPKENVRVKIKA